MDNGLYSVIYLDTQAREERVLHQEDISATHSRLGTANSEDLELNVEALLSCFPRVDICRSMQSCMTKLRSTDFSHTFATIVVVHVRPDVDDLDSQRRQARSPSPLSQPTTSSPAHSAQSNEAEAMNFLARLTAQHDLHKHHRAVVPVVSLAGDISRNSTRHGLRTEDARGRSPPNVKAWQAHCEVTKFLDAGAVDVLESPLAGTRVQSLPIQAHRECKSWKRGSSGFGLMPRRTSWVGGHDSKPYSYLREAMVSRLMDRICDPDYPEAPIDPSEMKVSEDRKSYIRYHVGTWGYSAHDFTDDELLFGSLTILEHALATPGLDDWRLSTDDLTVFLIACSRVYNSFVIYHNFRHACDVMQAVFVFLMAIGTIPPLHSDSIHPKTIDKSTISSILTPYHAITLLITAIGHDVGHPGVNNLFLVMLNAPLAQLYNDKSVLESFHCAAFSQILRRFWQTAFGNSSMRKLMIHSILATDMGLHSNYMTQLSNLQKKLHSHDGSIAEWKESELEENRELLCCLLIKCADICNVARKFSVATQWANILTDEFANQGKMEEELQLPTCLFGGPPVLNDVVKMGSSQIGFMNIFAGPLFGQVSRVLPGMRFASVEIETNRGIWEQKIEDARKQKHRESSSSLQKSKTISTARAPETSNRTDSTYWTPPNSAQLLQDERSRDSSRRASQAIPHSPQPPNSPPSGTLSPLDLGRRGSVPLNQAIAEGIRKDARPSAMITSQVNGEESLQQNNGDLSPREVESELIEQQKELISGSAGPMASPELPKQMSPVSSTGPPPPLQSTFKSKSVSELPRRKREKRTMQSETISQDKSGESVSSKTSRRFSLKFWRKSRSLGRSEKNRSREVISDNSERGRAKTSAGPSVNNGRRESTT